MATHTANGDETIDVLWLRSELKSAAESKKSAENLLHILQNDPKFQEISTNPLLIAYIGATESLMAKHVFSPMAKYNWCLKALDRFQDAITADPNGLEIRYLRLAVQINLPSFLHMSKEVPGDKKIIIETLLPTSTDVSLNHDVATLLLQHGRHECTPTEQEVLRKHI